MATGILSKGITIGYSTSSTSPITYTAIPDLQSIPDIGASPEKVEVTTLADSAKRYIAGIKDYGDLDFEFLYDNSAATSSYRVVRGLEDAGSVVNWQVSFADGTKFAFSGTVTTTITGVGVNDALTFKASIALNSDITVTNPTTSNL